MTKKKLPFGFQVQKEKRDLFKVEYDHHPRGKSSYGVRQTARTNRGGEEQQLTRLMRPDSGTAAGREEKLRNTTYEFM